MEDIGEETTILLAANGVRRSLTSGQVLINPPSGYFSEQGNQVNSGFTLRDRRQGMFGLSQG